MQFIASEELIGAKRKVIDDSDSDSDVEPANKRQKAMKRAEGYRLDTIRARIGQDIPELNQQLLREAWRMLAKQTNVGPSDQFADDQEETFRTLLDSALATLAVVKKRELYKNKQRMQDSLAATGMVVIVDATQQDVSDRLKRDIDGLYNDFVPDGVVVQRRSNGKASKAIHDAELGELLHPPHEPPFETDAGQVEVQFSANWTMRRMVLPFLRSNVELTRTIINTLPAYNKPIRVVPSFATRESQANDNVYGYIFSPDVTKGMLFVSQPKDGAIGFTAGSGAISFGGEVVNALLASYAISATSGMLVMYTNDIKYRKYDFSLSKGSIWFSGRPGRYVSYTSDERLYRLGFSFAPHTYEPAMLDKLNTMMMEGFIPDPFEVSDQPDPINSNLDAVVVYDKSLSYIPTKDDKDQFAKADATNTELVKNRSEIERLLLGYGDDVTEIEDMSFVEFKTFLAEELNRFSDIRKLDPFKYSTDKFQLMRVAFKSIFTAFRKILSGKYNPDITIPAFLAKLPRLTEETSIAPVLRIYEAIERVQGSWKNQEALPVHFPVLNYIKYAYLMRKVIDEKTAAEGDTTLLRAARLEQGKKSPSDPSRGVPPITFTDKYGNTLRVENDSDILRLASTLLKREMIEFNNILTGRTFDNKFDNPIPELVTFLEVIAGGLEDTTSGVDEGGRFRQEAFGPVTDYKNARENAVIAIKNAYVDQIYDEASSSSSTRGGRRRRRRS